VVSPSKNWQRVKNCCSATVDGVSGYCNRKIERAKVDQAKTWGLTLPADLDASRPLVVLIHGLDSNSGVWYSMAKLLGEQRYQVAYFAFPSDGPIAASAERLAVEMAKLHARWPGLRVDVVGHSMGGLVARAYIEGDRYTQAVDRFIAIAPPNHGSPWTRERFLLEANEQYWLWRCNKDWSPIWMFTDGHGEAADDLKPDSAFLKALNERPRRAGVRYTTIAGDHNILARFGSNAVGSVAGCVPNVWGLRSCRSKLSGASTRLAGQEGESDGVVPLESVKLAGVTDEVVLHADHNVLAMGQDGRPPAAWEVIRERLGR
jgi:pimeloyl-ACP methyl ester carboxylesterase